MAISGKNIMYFTSARLGGWTMLYLSTHWKRTRYITPLTPS
jgi:hypothetical protein